MIFGNFRKNKNAPSKKTAKDPPPAEKPSKNQQQKQSSNESYPPSLPSSKPSTSNALPNVQSKETILTDFDYSQTFSKRKLENNWSKYEELPDEEDNEQLLAANFEDMLLGPKTVGNHFTFSSEKHWDHLDANDASFPQTQTDNLFKLNLNLLKNGLGTLPFDIRLGYSPELFNDDEIADITTKAGCFDRFVKKTDGEVGEDLVQKFARIDAKIRGAKGEVEAEIVPVETKVSESVQPSSSIVPIPLSNVMIDTSAASESKAGSNEDKAPKQVPKPVIPAAPQAIENIQGWLDDILNNG